MDADQAYQWDTKRKLFSLVEVCAQLSAVLVFYSFVGAQKHFPTPTKEWGQGSFNITFYFATKVKTL